MPKTIKAALAGVDLSVDATYRGGRQGNAADDPLPSLLGVSTGGGFRYRGDLDRLRLVVLTSSLKDPDWPDTVDLESGTYTYYGDNKRPGRALHDTPRKGNELLRRIFDLASSGRSERRRVPPVLVFANSGEFRDVVFRGLAVPGTVGVRPSEDLVAVWKTADGRRFQNYRSRFSILDTPVVSRAWLDDVLSGNPHSSNAPAAWTAWVDRGEADVLRSTRSLEHRTKAEQLPQRAHDRAMLAAIRSHFALDYHAFEHCAAALARFLLPDIAAIDLTRRSRDGGRDAVGQFRIGDESSGILVSFALEAKCFGPSTSVGVQHMSRLISRLRHREFGILVTTSFVHDQAYREIREDGHPVIVVAATDIARLLRTAGYPDVTAVREWLDQNFPLDTPAPDST